MDELQNLKSYRWFGTKKGRYTLDKWSDDKNCRKLKDSKATANALLTGPRQLDHTKQFKLFDVSAEWLSQFEDIEKLKFLNRCISKRKGRFDVDTEWYVSYIEKFYNEKQFNKIYSKWLGTNDDYLRPTIDHINPRANGGNNDIDNLQFLTWFENRAKNDMPMVVWQKLKDNIKDYLL